MEISMLINVLNHGNDQIRELESQLDQSFSSETCKSLVSQAQAALATAISMANLLKFPESPLLATESSLSENSVKAFKEQERIQVFKKRKTMPKWNRQVRVCSGSSPMDDGYSWRKYGQKDILGSKFPRGYYRCTHRHTHGCLATKQVQRSDEDPSLFEISFRGDHTCATRDRRRIPEPPPEEENPSPETESFRIVSGDLGSSSSFSFPSICGPSDNMGGPNLCWSGSEMSKSPMASLDFGLDQFDFDAEFLFDFF